MKKMRYALIGCGRIAPNHIVAAQSNGIEIVALCDIDVEKANQLIISYNLQNVKVYSDYTAMLKSVKLDLVAIATESGKHAKIAIDCLKSGSNVIIEKPMALSICDADEIIKVSRECKKVVSVCHQNRFNIAVQHLKSELDNGALGKIFHITANVRWNRNKDYYEQAKWRGTFEQDGGALMNQCIHNIDLLLWLMGATPSTVVGMVENQNHLYIEGEDFGVALIKFGDSRYGVLEGTVNTYPNNFEETLCVFAEKGTVKIGGKSVNKIEEWRVEGQEGLVAKIKELFSDNPPNVYGYGHTPFYENTIHAIEKGINPLISAEEGKKAVELILGIYKSSKTRSMQELPIVNFSTLDMKT